jgi:nucleotide-binding universal stress UspA family protein
MMVALDLDQAADDVLDVAIDYATRLGSILVLAHVVPDTALPFPEARVATEQHPAGDPQEPILVGAARDRLDALAVRCADAELVVTEVVTHGDPAATVIDLVDTHDIDLLVVGTHGRQGLSRVLVGSVAEAILRRAPVPVLVVRTAEHAEPEP